MTTTGVTLTTIKNNVQAPAADLRVSYSLLLWMTVSHTQANVALKQMAQVVALWRKDRCSLDRCELIKYL